MFVYVKVSSELNKWTYDDDAIKIFIRIRLQEPIAVPVRR